MSKTSFRASAYLEYLTKGKSIRYIHSPFLFALMQEVFDDSKKNRESFFEKIESQRKKCKADTGLIQFEDFGAGGDTGRVKEVSVGIIASRAVKQSKYARFLYRLAAYLKSGNIVELGTSLGITTAYLSLVEGSRVHTIEADKNIQQIAQQNWKELEIENISSYSFDLNEEWSLLSDHIGKIDFLFVDANHRKEAMIRYVLQAFPYLHKRSVVVMDDIHWSAETFEAWKILKERKEVTLSFDIFQMGFLFFDKDLSKQDFTLKY